MRKNLEGVEMKYEKVAIGGTFDYLHDGHKAIIETAFEKGESVLIGIVSDHMELKKDSVGILPLEDRKELLEEYLEDMGWLDRAEICVIDDPYGPAASDSDLGAIVVTEETIANAKKINELREKEGLDSLEIIKIPLVLADDGEPISSIRIRYGEIDVHGKLRKEANNISDYG